MTVNTPRSASRTRPTRRAVIAGAPAALALGGRASAAPRPLKAYFHKGKGAVSIIGNPEHAAEQAAMTGVFAGGQVTVDTDSGRDQFLQRLMAADFAYLSLHANERLLVVGNGDRVTAAALAAARKAAGRGPRLLIVTGCKTTGDKMDADNVPEALGFTQGTSKQAYIGFHTIVIGISQDRYFRYFLPLWVNPGPGGAYRTLSEAATEAKALMQRRYELMQSTSGGTTKAGAALSLSPMDIRATGNADILGDANLRATDL
ncbi:MAG: hypothetical protein IPK81_18715 [Rhodospirillales bacterium]|nr:MAG: hypothetical protein IPK81_18715 [Rhodospirillales bacterium]